MVDLWVWVYYILFPLLSRRGQGWSDQGTKKMGSTAVLPVITSITKNLITMKKLLLLT